MRVIPDNRFDLVMNILTIAICAVATVMLIVNYDSIPQMITFQYSTSGVPESERGKAFLWVIVGIMWGLFFIFWATAKFSKKARVFNVHVTDENREKVLRAAKDMGACAKILIELFFFILLTYLMKNEMMPNTLSITCILLIVIVILGGGYRTKKAE